MVMSEKDNTKRKPEMPAQARRRTFTAAFKLKLLREVEARQAAGQEIGSVLRRERLYSSTSASGASCVVGPSWRARSSVRGS